MLACRTEKCAGPDGQIVNLDDLACREVDITFWHTRDGEEVDSLVEAGGRVTPIEGKFGTPDARALVRLGKIADSSWQPGGVVSLVSLGATDSKTAVPEGWLAASPLDLLFLEAT